MNVCEAHDDRHRNAPEPPHAQEAFAEYCAYVKKLERRVDDMRARISLECPRISHVSGVDQRPDECERTGMDAKHCNLAAGLGWEKCPRYPLEQQAEEG